MVKIQVFFQVLNCNYFQQVMCNLLAVDGANDPDIVCINAGKESQNRNDGSQINGFQKLRDTRSISM